MGCSDCKGCIFAVDDCPHADEIEDGKCPSYHKKHKSRDWKRPIKVALVGNANVGKSALFNQMTGLDQRTGNWAGKTVEVARGKALFENRMFEIIDLPGIYSLSSYTEEEEVTRDFLASEEAEVVVNVVDSTALERNLYLTTQILEMGVPVVLALNQADLAKKKGIRIDKKKLAKELGVPVVETVGLTGKGLRKTMHVAKHLAEIQRFHKRRGPRKFEFGKGRGPEMGSEHWMHHAHHLDRRYLPYGPEIEKRVRKLQKMIKGPINGYSPRFLAAKLVEGDALAATLIASKKPSVLETASRMQSELETVHEEDAATIMTQERYSVSNRVAKKVTTVEHSGKLTFGERFDIISTHPFFGYLILITITLGAFFLIFSIGDIVSEWIMMFYEWTGGYVMDAIGDGWLYLILWEGAAQGLIAGVAFVLPYILPFYILLSILEDSGYLARVAILLDSLMHHFGLHGKAFIPMLMGYGCTVPAVLGTRILETRRERFISAFMAGFLPCAARITVVMAVVGAFLGWYWAMGIFVFNILVIATLGLIASKVLPGKSYGLIMEVPQYHFPTPKVVMKQSWMRLKDFVVIALPIIVVGSVVLVVFELFSLNDPINWFFSPVTVWILGLPAAVGVILLLGVLRKELTVVMLVALWNTEALDQHMTAAQMLVFTLFVVFYIPCISTMAALFKEFGIRSTVILSLLQFVAALVIAGGANLLLTILL